MSGDPIFDANRRLAELALWIDGGARWIESATVSARQERHHEDVVVTFDRDELEAFIAGFRSIARAMLGLAQPVPRPLPTRPPLRIVGR